MQSTIKSLIPPTPNGTVVQPSEPDAAPLSIPIDWRSSHDQATVLILSAMLHAMFHQTLSVDAFELAMMQAQDTCMKSGVSEDDWERVFNSVAKNYMRERGRNPLSQMF